ncbi:hypothetical protein D6853_10665 [Butyrivibrio sp. X503]|uniref:hypothetical protein n=1 Tax=Butyrivibrio sp. X503 TaxID=2364878 RepID=UPI000EA89A44|nr:hypothetical protein [Butyrivibrio sp. X503]RKM55186.1 hypothetical protein D6853_10665 [Butyrivibrio sp. X503]
MKKIDKYISYAPIIYGLYLPFNFYVHIFEAYTGRFSPIAMNILDFIRIFVIAAFSYYLIKSYAVLEYEKNNEYGLKEYDPAKLLMIFAGVSFLELIYNIAMSGSYMPGSNENVNIIICVFLIIQYILETIVFLIISGRYNGGIMFGWIAANLVLIVVTVRTAMDPYEGFGFGVILLLFVVRHVCKAWIIYEHTKNDPEFKLRLIPFSKKDK